MRFDKAVRYGGIPIQQVREILRRTYVPFQAAEWAERWGLSLRRARALCRELHAAGLLERDDRLRGGWKITRLGYSLVAARFTRPYRRETADAALRALIDRARALEGDGQGFAYRVRELRVYGSYLRPEAASVGDLDVAYRLAPRLADSDAQWELEERIRRAKRNWSGNYVEYLFLPQREVLTYLRAGRAIYQFINADEREAFVGSVESRVVYTLGDAAASP